MSDQERDDDGLLVVDRPPADERQRMDPPPRYAVVFLNDDFTPMDWVVGVIVTEFGKSMDEAAMLMLEVHEKGKAMIASFPKDIAETKAVMVNQKAQVDEHPFKATVEALH